jgi:hypothetical protein
MFFVHESHLQVCVGDSLEDCGVVRGDNVTGEIRNVVASTSLIEDWSPTDREEAERIEVRHGLGRCLF